MTVVIPDAMCLLHLTNNSQNKKDKVDVGDVTLTTTMTTNKIERLVVLAARWNGPISVAAKITSVDDLRSGFQN